MAEIGGRDEFMHPVDHPNTNLTTPTRHVKECCLIHRQQLRPSERKVNKVALDKKNSQTDAARHRRALESFKEHTGKDYEFRLSPSDPPSITDIASLGLDRTYGESWCRPGLDLKTKSLITMTVVATLGCDDYLHNHIVAAHNVGVTKDEVVDWLIHLNGYLGTPRTNVALRVAREVWTKMANAPA